MQADPDWLIPDWPAPPRIGAVVTTRAGGVSEAPFDSMNLGNHVDDEPAAVATNRRLLRESLGTDFDPQWLRQVHGTRVIEALGDGVEREADASTTATPGQPCAVMTADCLPVLFCATDASEVGAAHAGWRGLADGVLEATVQTMQSAPENLLAWMGPAIGPEAFEVGPEVRARFLEMDPECAAAFLPAVRDGHWMADMYALARRRLQASGVSQIHGGGLCTYSDSRRFYSFRRDQRTGRMASLIWIKSNAD